MNCKFFNVARGCKGSDLCRRFQKSRKRQIALVARASVVAEERREYRLGRATDVARDALDELFDPPQELRSCSSFTSVFVDAFFMEAFFSVSVFLFGGVSSAVAFSPCVGRARTEFPLRLVCACRFGLRESSFVLSLRPAS